LVWAVRGTLRRLLPWTGIRVSSSCRRCGSRSLQIQGMPTQHKGSSETAAAERGMTDEAEPKSYQPFMQIHEATGRSWFLAEGTTKSRAMQSHAGACVCCDWHALSIFPSPRQAWQGLEGSGRKDPPRMAGCFFFFPKHWLKTKDTGSPSLADAVETMGDFSLGKLRSPSAYSLRVQAALRNVFVLGL